MLKHPGNIIGDSWFHVEGDVAHAFYLTCADHLPAHKVWDIGHAVSSDLVNWTLLDLALRRGEAGSWDECLATGSIVKTADGYTMAYTSSNKALTGIAWSRDLSTWTRHTGNPTTACDERYYELMSTGTRKALHWRDPFVFKHDDQWHQLVCASNRAGPEGGRGTVGWAVSDDLKAWTVLPPPQIEPFSQEMECPQIYHRDNIFYLIFSTFPELLLPDAHARIQAADDWGAWMSSLPWNVDKQANHGPSTFVLTSRNLRGLYRPSTHPTLFRPSDPVQPYACQLLRFKDADYCLGTIWADDGISYISDPIKVSFQPGGIRVVP
ncbi:MAG: hypothetical protein LBK99_23575 [Opitutaceae bacterium]|jgi:beta-fructofuranosidase|nr:hypothetical protein [Opitutaceae bacterium]